MDITGKVLDILFRQTSPERVLQSLKQRVEGDRESFFREESRFDQEKKNLFMDFAESTLDGYSENEQEMLYQRLDRQENHWGEKNETLSGFLAPLIQYGLETLVLVDGEPQCRQEKALAWRDVYLRLGQDTIVCPFLAYQDNQKGIKRSDFTWPAILRINDIELYHMLGRGMAENHNHINGGTHSFQITWCRLMNYPEKIREELRHFQGSSLRARMSRSVVDNSLNLYDQAELAALLRAILFRAIHRTEFKNTDPQGSAATPDQGTFNSEQAFYKEYLNVFSFRKNLVDLIDCLRFSRGVRLDYPDKSAFCLDYLLGNTMMGECINSHIRVLAGERLFLYQCAGECLPGGGFSSFEQGLFYLYLLLKCNFRSEMIQANEQTGFKNFQNYQDRKDDAWDKNPYFWEAARIAINDRLSSEAIVSLEGRLVPKSDPRTNIKKVIRFDLAKRFADRTVSEALDHSKYSFDPEFDVDQFIHLPYFFVFHFVKSPEDRRLEYGKFREVSCRHQTLRRNLRETAVGLAESLRRSAYLRSRVRGIDASANEVGCRPEVFAISFRYIDGVQQKWNVRRDSYPYSPMRISKTYHAGEDFLDIADGLRAIDEAIEFLDLGPGSRIGHAVAMGVLPEDHYRLKNYEIITTKQDRLDDLIWLLYRSKELGVQIEGKLESQLYSEAYRIFREIYGEAIQSNGWNCGLEDYYHSMKLRGDDPSEYYPQKKPRNPLGMAYEFHDDLFHNNDPKLEQYRENLCVSGLYYYYHYGAAEGLRGQQIVICPVGKAYMALMRQIQDALRYELEARRIIIECNPSSNVLIGTFRRYEHHPIFRFNRRKLGPKAEADGTQLHVCVNTDDLGVFDTSLEFEYALLEQALLSQRDDLDRHKYNARDVMEYLNDLREMGLTAVFPENQ